MLSANEFDGRVAVVTGGSAGLGFDFCRQLVEFGCRVYFCSRRENVGRNAEARLGENARYFRADVSDPADISAFADFVRAREGHIDYLINNVAVDDRIPFDEVDVDAADRMWRINLRSYILVTREFLDMLKAGEGKSIVNISTTNYMFGFEAMTTYNATKSGILGFTRSLARELGRFGIRANVVSPGWIMTEKQLEKYVDESAKRGLINDQCLKFLIYPEHVTPVVMFLLSSAAKAVTGQDIVVDGGKYMH